MFGVSHSIWEYRYRYDQVLCGFVIEINSGGFSWEVLRTISDNRHREYLFQSRAEAEAKVRALGLDQVYRLNHDQEKVMKECMSNRQVVTLHKTGS